MKLSTVLWFLVVAGAAVLAACGLFNAAAAASGNERAASPEGRDLALIADDAFWTWYNYVFGPAGGAAGTIAAQKAAKALKARRARAKAA